MTRKFGAALYCWLADFLQLEQYLLRGQRGSSKTEFILFLIANVLFLHIITYLWADLSNKPLILYREYCGYTLTYWNAFAAVIMCRVGRNFLRSLARIFCVGLVVLFSQGCFTFTYMVIYVQSAHYDISYFLNLATGYFSVFPILTLLSFVQSSNIIFKHVVRIAFRIAFFVTPVIWIANSDVISGDRLLIVQFNPLFYGFVGINSIDGVDSHQPIIEFFGLGVASVIVFILTRFGFDRVTQAYNRKHQKNKKM